MIEHVLFRIMYIYLSMIKTIFIIKLVFILHIIQRNFSKLFFSGFLGIRALEVLVKSKDGLCVLTQLMLVLLHNLKGEVCGSIIGQRYQTMRKVTSVQADVSGLYL